MVHSATKYLNGHSDVVAGLAVVGSNKDLAERLGYLQNAIGGVLDPFSSFLTLRGIRTLSLRVEKHSANALAIAQWLEQHPQVDSVFYPGLASHPQYALARRQMALPGGMISVVIKGDAQRATEVIRYLTLFTGGKPWRCGESGEPALQHDPRLHSTGAASCKRHCAAAYPPVGGD